MDTQSFALVPHCKALGVFMSCSECTLGTPNGIDGFPTEKSFLEYRKIINGLVLNKKLIHLEHIKETGPFRKTFYMCSLCNQKWELTDPNQAYRGGFKPVNE